MKSLCVPAKTEKLDEVLAFVMGELENYDCSPGTHYQIELAVEEVFVNIASYAYQPAEGDAEILCEVLREPLRIRIQFRDRGTPFDPLARERVDTSPDAFMDREGGLGIFLIKEIMDEVRYSYENGKNILTILKKL